MKGTATLKRGENTNRFGVTDRSISTRLSRIGDPFIFPIQKFIARITYQRKPKCEFEVHSSKSSLSRVDFAGNYWQPYAVLAASGLRQLLF